MEMLGLAADRFSLFWLVLARVSGLFLVTPIFGNRVIPVPVRISLLVLTSLIVLPVVAPPADGVPDALFPYVFILARELVLGLAMGFVVLLVFAAAEMVGQLLDIEMGFGLVNVIDPVMGHPLPLMGNFFNLLAMLLFIVTDAHHLVFVALVDSFAVAPVGAGSLTGAAMRVGFDEVASMFYAAVRIAAPMLAILFLTSVVLGLTARAAPQLNMFVVGVPVKVAVGFIGLALAMPVYVVALRALFPQAYANLLSLFRVVTIP